MQGDSEDPAPRALLALLRERFALDWRGIHGAPHWARVRKNGLVLAERTGASRRVVSLFAFLHDSCRTDEGRDAKHGQRAAALAAITATGASMPTSRFKPAGTPTDSTSAASVSAPTLACSARRSRAIER